MPVSVRGSHPKPTDFVEDDFQRLLKKTYKPQQYDPDFERLIKKPYKPWPRPGSVRVPSIKRIPRAPGLGSLSPFSPLNLAPYIPGIWPQGPLPVMPPFMVIHGPCTNMRPDIEFWRWTGTAVLSASCISGQGQGGASNGSINERYGDDASWNITIPALGKGYVKKGYWGLYELSPGTWRGQHRLSIEKYAYKAPYKLTDATPEMQLYPRRLPVGRPMPDPNNWPSPESDGGPDAGTSSSPAPAPAPDPLGVGSGGSFVTETADGPIAAAIVSPGTKPQPAKLGPTAPPGARVREAPKQRGPARLGRMLFKVLDNISESCEVVDSLFEALPNDAKKAAMKKAGYVWSSSAKKYVLPGNGKGNVRASDDKQDGVGQAGTGSRAFVDNFGQYGLDGCDWKAAALYQYADRLDVCGGIQNILKNYLEDKIHGVIHRYRPKNTVNALAGADKEFGVQVNALLDELVDLCPK